MGRSRAPTLGGGHAGFEKRPSRGPRRTAGRVGGGGTLVATRPQGQGDMRKLHVRPRKRPLGGRRRRGGAPTSRPQGGAVAEGLPRREVQARQGVLCSKTTQGAQALRRTGVGSAEGFAC